jgi:uncharacterized protein (DUF934 family)
MFCNVLHLVALVVPVFGDGEHLQESLLLDIALDSDSLVRNIGSSIVFHQSKRCQDFCQTFNGQSRAG